MRAEGDARRPETERHGRGRPARIPSVGSAPGVPSHPLVTLQNSAGNAAVVQLLRQAGHPGAQGRAGGGAAEDRHQHGPGCGHQESGQPQLQRSAVHDVLRSGGRPLDEATRSDMEARLGADFSDVRIHDDAAARASAAEVGAHAYTSGSHVVIGDGGGDRHTLAHELTHVIQQRHGPVAGNDNGTGVRVSDPGDAFERAAEANATRALSGPAPKEAVAAQRSVAASSSAAVSVQRREDNPYAKPDEHDGWTTTAHHIVAHSTLLGALGRLDEKGRKEVLVAAVPREITTQMLVNLKVTVPEGENTPEFRRDLRKKLASKDKPDSNQVYGISYADIVSGKHRDFTTAASGGGFEYYGGPVNDAQARGHGGATPTSAPVVVSAPCLPCVPSATRSVRRPRPVGQGSPGPCGCLSRCRRAARRRGFPRAA